MADNKYGRIFTEQDVRMIVQAAIESDCESDEELTKVIETLDNGQELKFPPDEPIFILRAQDAAAIPTIAEYYSAAEEHGSPDEHLSMVGDTREAFQQFSDDNPDRMKAGD